MNRTVTNHKGAQTVTECTDLQVGGFLAAGQRGFGDLWHVVRYNNCNVTMTKVEGYEKAVRQGSLVPHAAQGSQPTGIEGSASAGAAKAYAVPVASLWQS